MVDSRDPLMYYSSDLASYALELHPTKRTLVLLNKADLLPKAVRLAWADYFACRDVDFAFWSAKAAQDASDAGRSARAACPNLVLHLAGCRLLQPRHVLDANFFTRRCARRQDRGCRLP